MQPSPTLAPTLAPDSAIAARVPRGRKAEDLAYQAVAAAAMLATLISIWLF